MITFGQFECHDKSVATSSVGVLRMREVYGRDHRENPYGKQPPLYRRRNLYKFARNSKHKKHEISYDYNQILKLKDLNVELQRIKIVCYEASWLLQNQ